MRPRPRRQRVAISQAKISRECKLLGPIHQGTVAFRKKESRSTNPHKGEERVAWFQGWDLAQDKQWEKDSEYAPGLPDTEAPTPPV